jgi:hypothetical protein
VQDSLKKEELEVAEEDGDGEEDRFFPARETARIIKYKRTLAHKLSRHPPEPPPPELVNFPHIKKVKCDKGGGCER